ncbi:hypothetical protein FNH04_41665, partial [Streptomyces phyllanthi]
RPAPDTADDVIRWAVFSCVLVPVVLVWYGTSLAGAAGTALGLAAVTGVCRLLLRQSERGAARTATRAPADDPARSTAHPPAEMTAPRRGRHGRGGPGAHRRKRRPGTPGRRAPRG